MDALRIHINLETPRSLLPPLTCEQLIAHYVERELAEDSRITLDTYTQALTPAKREAQT
jgi:hypothetical protein